MKRIWTDNDKQTLIDNYHKMPHAQLAKLLGRGVPATYVMIRKLKLKRHWTPEEDNVLRQHTHGRGGWEKVAKALNRTVVSVRSRVVRIGCQMKMLKAGDLKRLRELHAAGLRNWEIGKELGVSDECVRRWLNLWKLPMNGRNEQQRIEAQKRNFLKNYGVESVARAAKIRRQRARKAAFAAGVQELSKALEAKICKQ